MPTVHSSAWGSALTLSACISSVNLLPRLQWGKHWVGIRMSSSSTSVADGLWATISHFPFLGLCFPRNFSHRVQSCACDLVSVSPGNH